METQIDQIIRLARKQGMVSSANLHPNGISPSLLCYMANRGMLRRVSRGVYALPDHISVHETFIEIALKIPNGVICLLSALQFHELTSQMPFETWVAIKKGSHYPRSLNVPVKIIQLSGENFSAGIKTITEDGIKISVYNPAKTVVDCFRFRNKIGSDVAVDALRDAIKQKQATTDEIWEYARLCRATKVMRPYMEAI
jgi:predicted transcriptional regulator of viral defense system